MVRLAKEKYYQNAFQNVSDPTTTWKRLKHLGLLKPKKLEKSLIFSVEDLNEFFSNTTSLPAEQQMRNPVYLGEENYEDSKFYWSNIER